ncbi:MAG: hypothetical protein M0014_10765 [Actinomycetota bacterium]|jgi:hypothetical protein|nr:hypothetical protein [Actinomycetota bacterium]
MNRSRRRGYASVLERETPWFAQGPWRVIDYFLPPDYFLPAVNSPRVGRCGYDGPAEG